LPVEIDYYGWDVAIALLNNATLAADAKKRTHLHPPRLPAGYSFLNCCINLSQRLLNSIIPSALG